MTEQLDYLQSIGHGVRTDGTKLYRVSVEDTIYQELRLESKRSGVPIYELAHFAFINYLGIEYLQYN